jgi:hypothetical protein
VSEPKGRRNEQMTHPDPEVLAEFRAGLITGRPGARISAHLATCDHCAGLSGELAEISALLAAVPPPVMPDRVAQRLDSALVAEAARRDNPQRAGADRAAAPMTGPPPRRRWDFRLVALRVLAPAAAVAVLAAGGYGLSRVGSSPVSPVAAGRPATTAATQPQTSALPSAGAENRPNAVPAIKAPASFQVVTSQTDFQRATLRQQVTDQVQLNARGAAGPAEPAAEPVRECVSLVTGGVSPGTLVLVEKARFQGQPAIVIVAADGSGDRAWVTSASCSAASDDVLAQTALPGTSAP